MAYRLLNNAKMTVSAVASAGTGAFTLSAASAGFDAFTTASPTGLSNTDTSTFMATEGTAWELFIGTYTSSGTSLARTTRIDSSTGAAVVFTTAAAVAAVASVADIQTAVNITGGTITGITDLAVADGGTGSSTAGSALSNLLALGKRIIVVRADDIVPFTTTPASLSQVETVGVSYPMVRSMDFSSSAAQYAQFVFKLPKNWWYNGGGNAYVAFQPIWTHPATTTNFGVVWEFCPAILADADDMASAVVYSAAATSTDTGGATNNLYIGPWTSAVYLGAPVADPDVNFGFVRVARLYANASDTMAVNAKLLAVVMRFTITGTLAES